jgi:stress response protein YsnF
MEKLQKKVKDIEDTTIPLIGEKSEESKNIQVDQTTLTKEPVIETKIVQVPLVHEKVTIEKGPPITKQKHNRLLYLQRI